MEQELARMLWAQAWQVSVLILAVAIVSRSVGRNRPHVAHALWLVVLVKAVTPPVWSSPSGIFSWLQPATVTEDPIIEPEEPPAVPEAAPSVSSVLARELLDEDWPAVPQQEITTAKEEPSNTPRILEAEAAYFTEEAPLEPIPAAEPPQVSTEPPKWSAWSVAAIAVWLLGAFGSLFLSLARWMSCWREIRRAGVLHDPMAQQLLEDLLSRLRVRRKVRLIISQSRIGPAVLGIFRPTVLIPARIIAGKTPADLEPILAHELIHVRRGDLWVGWLQVLVAAVWWFHPLVWWAGRRLKHEAERCCDEEVIAELALKPARYARALLDVLELKHILKPVPVLPGVKPVEITSNRLERIMLLGQGCRKRTPWWCWLMMLLTAALTLPGAAFVASAKDKPNRQSERKSETPTKNPFKSKSFKVADLLDGIQSELDVENETLARTALAELLKNMMGELWHEETLLPSGEQLATPSIAIKGNTLRVRHTPRVLEAIAEQLDILREHGFAQIVIEARIITASRGVLDKAVPSWKVISSENPEDAEGRDFGSEAGNSLRTTIEKSVPLRMAVLEDPQVKKLLEACQSDARSNLMFCPKVTVFNGQRATIQSTVQRPFIVGISSDGKPTIRVVSDGTTIKLRSVMEDDHIRLESQLTFSDIRNVEVVDLPVKPGEEAPAKVQVPEVATTRINTTVQLPSGGSVLLGGLKLPKKKTDTTAGGFLESLGLTSKPQQADQQLFVMLRVVHLRETSSDVEVRYAQKAAKIADLEYQKALEANRRLKGSVSELEVERLKLVAEMAHLKVEQARHEFEKAKQRIGQLMFGLDAVVSEQKKPASDQAASRGVLLFFTADWCGPCQQMAPIISRLKDQGYPVRNVDVDKERPLAQSFNVRSMPTFILIVDRKEQNRIVGKTSEAQLRRMLAQIPADPPKAMPHKTLPYHGQGVNSDAGVTGQIILDEKDGASLKIEPPTDEEVLEAARKQNSNKDRPFPKNAEWKNVRIIKEKVSESAEPPKLYPLVGLAQEHKARFKCNVICDIVQSDDPVPRMVMTGAMMEVHINKTALVPANQPLQPVPVPPKAANSSLKDPAVVPSAYLKDDVQYLPAGPDSKPMPKAPQNWNELAKSERRATSSEAENTIEKQLDKKITLHFKNTPLSEVVKHIATDAGINIVVDNLGLSEEGVKPDQAVTIDVEDVKLSSALKLVLEPLHLGFLIEDEVLKITSRVRQQGKLLVITYPVADLIVPIPQKVTVDLREKAPEQKPAPPKPAREEFEGLIRPTPKRADFDFDSLTQLITTTVEPDSWAEKGGGGSIRSYETTLSLVIRQSEPVHDQVRDLLTQLRALQDLQVVLAVRTIDGRTLGERLTKKLKSGRTVLLAPEDVEAFELRSGKDAKTWNAPKITLYNGQMAHLNLPSDNKTGFGLDLAPVISADRRFVRLGVTFDSETAKDRQNSTQLTLKDGYSVLVDAAKPGSQKILIVTPKIIVQEEEEVLLGIPSK